MYCWFLALKFTSSCHFNKSRVKWEFAQETEFVSHSLCLRNIVIYATVCRWELYSNMFLWAVLLDSTNEGQVFTDKPFCDDQ